MLVSILYISLKIHEGLETRGQQTRRQADREGRETKRGVKEKGSEKNIKNDVTGSKREGRGKTGE